ncbi:MAG: hypothetical protein JWL99_5170 [Streptomyces oryziradicis]|nr:hypothetical protein [Actinacidiphila oryziradicis]
MICATGLVPTSAGSHPTMGRFPRTFGMGDPPPHTLLTRDFSSPAHLWKPVDRRPGRHLTSLNRLGRGPTRQRAGPRSRVLEAGQTGRTTCAPLGVPPSVPDRPPPPLSAASLRSARTRASSPARDLLLPGQRGVLVNQRRLLRRLAGPHMTSLSVAPDCAASVLPVCRKS